ncbi:baseplate assembly protein [Acinetobacter sp. HY1485]|uniref:baseplate assembly protein n=1 Tax=Acinetobacter sp. HY1485 TaxID=2970918 RepID=UPI0022B9540B|nr:baseplate J/gp47 family protein [Acinetobacter sp. HY1485]
MNVNFKQLPIPQMIETLDYETLLEERKNDLVSQWETEEEQATIKNILARESEPLTKYLQENVYRELTLRNRINNAALSNLLAFATGSDLDAVAANYDVIRLLSSEATNDTAALYETDEELRTRTQMKFDSLSTAGPENAYKYYAFSADGRVADVSVISPDPAIIEVYLLQKDTANNAATDNLIQLVAKALNAEDVRPIGDRVSVKSAEIIPYQIHAKIYINRYPEDASLLDVVQSNIQEYISQQKRLGRSIYLSEIHAKLHISGVNHLILEEPNKDIILTNQQAGFCTDLKIELGN